MTMVLNGGVVRNYGTIMKLVGNDTTVYNEGTIMNNTGGYAGRVVYQGRNASSPESDRKLKQLKDEVFELRKELQETKNDLNDEQLENRRLRHRIGELERERDRRKCLMEAEEMLQMVMDVNREQAKRIKELEQGVIDDYMRQQIDPWDMRPTKEQCKELLKQFSCFLDSEE